MRKDTEVFGHIVMSKHCEHASGLSLCYHEVSVLLAKRKDSKYLKCVLQIIRINIIIWPVLT